MSFVFVPANTKQKSKGRHRLTEFVPGHKIASDLWPTHKFMYLLVCPHSMGGVHEGGLMHCMQPSPHMHKQTNQKGNEGWRVSLSHLHHLGTTQVVIARKVGGWEK